MRFWTKPLLVTPLVLLSIGSPAVAQSPDDGWRVDVALYGMGAGITRAAALIDW